MIRSFGIWGWVAICVGGGLGGVALGAEGEGKPGVVLEVGARRELFVDSFLIDLIKGAALKLHAPRLAGPSAQPPPALVYATILKDGDTYHLYTRGDRVAGNSWKTLGVEAYHANEVTLYARSTDGINWVEPDLGLHAVERYPKGNVILADEFGVCHNFTPFIDERPGVPAGERFKALGGLAFQANQKAIRDKRGPGGLKAFVSADGVRWKKLRDEAVVPEQYGKYFDSQNVSFWSEAEQCYVCYFRSIDKGMRSVARTTSKDFVTWTPPVLSGANGAGEHLYTSGAQPYFRAPHVYVGLPTRFQAKRGATTDVLFMSSRGGKGFDRTFMEAFIRPGPDPAAWADRANYAAYRVIPTGAGEMSIWVTPTRRYVARLDGFTSVNAPWAGGEMVTKAFTFAGKELEINCSTSAGGSIKVEIQDAAGQAVAGFGLEECVEIVADQVERVVAWKGGGNVSALAGKAVRLRFVMQDADLYSLRFR